MGEERLFQDWRTDFVNFGYGLSEMRAKLNLLLLENIPILEQLQIEEALVRADSQNWCLINRGSTPSIVMGISGKREELIDETHFAKSPLPIIRRFSGGGTVVIDESTLFVTFLFQRNTLDFGSCPVKVMQWSESMYKPLFSHVDFSLRENDYVIGSKKIGGNAQYFTKECWLHHTSFLWDYNFDKMQLLKLPQKRPQYRQDRSHTEFLDTLNSYFPSQEVFLDRLLLLLQSTFEITINSQRDVSHILSKPYRKTVIEIDVFRNEGFEYTH